MKEIVLRHFFEGHATAAELDADVVGTLICEGPERGPQIRRYNVLPMERKLELRSDHLIRLVDASLSGDLRPEHLEVVASWLETAFERFPRDADTPDGERVVDALFWLGDPDINYPLSPRVLAKIRRYLATGENTLSPADSKAVINVRPSNGR